MSFLALINRVPDVPQSLADFADKHDPYFGLASLHNTLIFPTPDSIGQERLTEHIRAVLRHFRPFHVRFNHLERSWDNWLFLTPVEGGEEITRMHDELYTGIMKPYLREDIPYVPHLSLGLFARKEDSYDIKNPEALELDSAEYEDALRTAEALQPDIAYRVDECELVEINDSFTKIQSLEKFEL